MKTYPVALIMATVLAATAWSAHATTWFVAADGNDASNGVAWAAAFATPAQAVSVASSGDTIMISNGTYAVSAPIEWNLGGLVLQGAGDEASDTVLQGSGARILALRGANNVVSNLQFTGATSEAVFVQDGSGTVFGNCAFVSNAYGLVLSNANTCVISDSVFADNTTAGVWLRYSQNNTWQDCRFLRNRYGLYNGEGSQNRSGDSRGQKFSRCVFAHNTSYAAYLNADRSGMGTVYNHCTFFNNNNCVFYGHYEGGIITNSIVAATASVVQAFKGNGPLATLTVSLLFGNGSTGVDKTVTPKLNSTNGKLGPNLITGDPSLVDPFRDDYRLYADSPAQGLAADGTAYGAYPNATDTVPLPIGTSYYVRTDGNDAATGLTDTPSAADGTAGAFKTLQHAAVVAAPGDVIEVLEGSYIGPLVLNGASSVSKPILFRGVDDVFVGGSPSGIIFSNASHVVVDNLTVANCSSYGVRVQDSVSWVLTNCVIRSNTSGGVFAKASNGGTIDSCVISNNAVGINFESSSGNMVRRSWVMRNSSWGVYATKVSAQSSGNHICESALCMNGGGVSLVTDSGHYDWLFLNSVIFNNSGDGIKLHVRNFGFVTNCIVAANGSIGLNVYNVQTDLMCDYNSVYGNGTDYSYATMGASNLYSDVKFVDPYAYDFRLYANSPCVDTGLGGLDMGMYPNEAAVELAGAKTYYVAPDGHDGNDGLSGAKAFASVVQAAGVVAYGDTVEIAEGVYTGFVHLISSGMEDAPITFRGHGMVELIGLTDAFHASAAGYVHFENLTLRGLAGHGLIIEDSIAVSVSNCVVTTCTGDGIRLLRSTDSVLTDITVAGNSGCGIYLLNAHRMILCDSIVRDNTLQGIRVGDNRYAPTVDTIVRRCLIARNSNGIQFDGDSSNGWLIENCTIVNNRGMGCGCVAGNYITNTSSNTVYAYNAGAGIYMQHGSMPFTHCLFYGNGGNVTANNASYITSGDRGGHVYDEPSLVKWATSDGALYADSPALGAGANGDNIGVYAGAGVVLPAAATYYVRTDGNDVNSGLANTSADAFASISNACIMAVNPGDVVRVQSGVYTGQVAFSASGSRTQPIRLVADGESVLQAGSHGMVITNAANIRVEGLTVRGATTDGIALRDANNCTLDQVVSSDNGRYGVYIYRAAATTLVDSEIGNSRYGVYPSGSPAVLIDRCRIHDNTQHGLYCDGQNNPVSIGLTVRQSLIYGNADGLYVDNYGELTLESSLVVDNSTRGIYIQHNGATKVIRNTLSVYNGQYGIYREGASYALYNNNFFGNGIANYYNVTLDVDSLVADPLFRNYAAGDYRLLPGSPCIDAGTNQTWMVDAFDLGGLNPRIANKIVDIGVFEVISNGSVLIVR